MHTIYVIKNNITGDQYVGKTSKQLQHRFREHVRYSRREDKCHLPLYQALRRYGAQNFCIEMLEEIEDCYASAREIYWIARLGTYGMYNSTRGGDGRYIVNKSLVAELYRQLGSIKRVRNQTGYDDETIRHCLNEAGIPIKSGSQHAKERFAIPTRVIDGDGVYNDFPSRQKAAEYISLRSGTSIRSIIAHIPDAIAGKRKTVCGFRQCNTSPMSPDANTSCICINKSKEEPE